MEIEPRSVEGNRLQIPSEWTGVEMPFPRELSVIDLFRAHVKTRPEALAIKDGGRSLTYAELDVRSNCVANQLVQRGLQFEDPVAVFLPASCEFLVAIFGVLKAGGSYFPLDVDTPAKRLKFLLVDSGSRFLLTNATCVECLRNWPGIKLDLAQIICTSNAETQKNPDVPSDPNRRAYITYTSGSTGQPKGVEIEHHSLTNFVSFYHQRLNLSVRDRASMLRQVAFDGSVADIWPTLCAGGSLTIPPKGLLLHPHDFINWLAVEEVTLTFVPTGLAEILFTRPWPKRMKLQFLATGGDRLRVRPPADLPFTVFNGYGPTENTVFSTWSVVTPEDGKGQPPPIGRPLGNVKTYVLDEHKRPVPIGVPGELYLGGEQVARGYLRRPELTAERFPLLPIAEQSAGRVYRTGDWVRWLPEGELDFLGRKDDQIQIRGRRVELGEIEATLYSNALVQQVCCVPLLDEGMPSGTVAHIVLRKPGADPSDELRSYLRARVPDYMVPSEFVIHERLPLTSHGKFDRKKLMDLRVLETEQPQNIRAEDGLEEALARLWHSLLPIAKSSQRDTTFAALGGDSLLSVKLMLGVEEIIGQRIELSTFLLEPTLGGLCRVVRRRLNESTFQPVLALRKKGARLPLFCLYTLSGDVDLYFDLVEALGNDQPVFGIRSPALADLARLPDSIENAAAETLRWIRQIQPDGPPALIGYSWAGLLAFEMARQLAHAEGASCFTALIGTCAPTLPTTLVSRLWHFTTAFPQWTWKLMTHRGHRRRRLSRWLDMAINAKNALSGAPLPLPLPLPEWASSPISRHLYILADKYQPAPIHPVQVEFFRERGALYSWNYHPLHPWDTSWLPDGGWSRWSLLPPRVYWLDGDHKSILKSPAVSGLARELRKAMDQHFVKASPLAGAC
jgi:amino acid adenylation domain-containing protein